MSKFVWFEYVSTDAAKAQGFYGELFGWGAKKVPLPGGDYAMIAQGDATIGGYSEPLPGAPARAHWLSHLGVGDVKAAAKRATSSGGRVVVAPMAVGHFGTMAIVADPGGATFALWQPAKADDQAAAEGHFRFCWNELYTRDMKTAVAFYRAVGELDEESMTLGDQPYTMLLDGKEPVAGICPPPPFDPPLAWQPVVAVPDADASLASAKRLGAKILAPIEDVPGIGRFFVIADPLGAVLGILQRA